MGNLLETMSVAASGMRAQSTRLRHVAENIANADTPGYRRKVVSFEMARLDNAADGVKTGAVQLDRAELPSVYDPSHPLADESGHYQGSQRQADLRGGRQPRSTAQL